jgi:hypothetical protein
MVPPEQEENIMSVVNVNQSFREHSWFLREFQFDRRSRLAKFNPRLGAMTGAAGQC